MSEQNTGRALEWDDTIERDNDEFILLEPGEYDFAVTSMERKRFAGSPKLPPCNMATLKIRIADETTVEHNLFLHSKTEGMICAFFKAIGARKHGEKIQMDWNKVAGATGRCIVETRTWKSKSGEEMKSNQIKKFLEPAEAEQSPDTDGIPF